MSQIAWEINQIIERYIQQQFPIIYADKGKERLQILAVTSKQIQLLTWKKTKVEFPTNLSYHYTPESAINISSADTFTLHATSTFRQLPFQSKQKKAELLRTYVPMAYAPITKFEKFTGKKDDTQVWLNNVQKTIAANRWDDARAMQAIPYFLQDTANLCNNNSINQLANTFTTIKQEENEAVTTYLGHFYRNLHQIQTIQADYFTVPQILNQFIRGLYSSIFQHVCPMHPADLQAVVTNARDFEAAELEANHVQAVNLVMNE
ncbi:hypothetical protein G9A89_000126 [Geosiphon pyriformis]|nr:hypothetical protein G9A89_000126 [Geosiphon pyriformis]